MKSEFSAESADASFVDVLKGVGQSAKDLVIEQGALVKTEFNATLREVGQDLRNTLVFGGLFISGVLPFLLFLVFGLGALLEGRLWLSSLIVALGWGAVTGSLAYSYLQKLKKQDPTLPATRHSVQRGTERVIHKVEDVKDVIKNESH